MDHKNGHNDLSPELIKSYFDYSPETGQLRWIDRPARRIHIGDIAGFPDDQSRIKIGIGGKEYFAHRIIWVWVTGKWPDKEIDHINENPSDNRWANLREATPSQNHRNRGKQRNNTTGYKGVTFVRARNKYVAGVKLNGKRYNVGRTFSTAEEAYEAVCKLAAKLHGDWSRYT